MPYENTVVKGEFSRVFISDYIQPDIFDGLGNILYYKADNPFNNEINVERPLAASIYKAIHESAYKLTTWNHIDAVREMVSAVAGLDISIFALKLVLNVFAELEFFKYEQADGMMRVFFADNIKKRQLAESRLYEKYVNSLLKRG